MKKTGVDDVLKGSRGREKGKKEEEKEENGGYKKKKLKKKKIKKKSKKLNQFITEKKCLYFLLGDFLFLGFYFSLHGLIIMKIFFILLTLLRYY